MLIATRYTLAVGILHLILLFFGRKIYFYIRNQNPDAVIKDEDGDEHDGDVMKKMSSYLTVVFIALYMIASFILTFISQYQPQIPIEP